jgi:thiosulfate reductase cytochrome b subunit
MSTIKKVFLHPLPVRIWHWINALGFIVLILTGLQIRYRDLIGLLSFESAVRVHNVVGFVLIGSYLFWLLFYLTSDKIKNYHADMHPMHYYTTAINQAIFYGYGIFRGKENPHHASAYTKFNPMQKLTYQLIMMVVIPVQLFSGLFMWDVQRFSGIVNAVGGVRVMDTIHMLLFIFFAAFLPVHVYLTTLGHTPLAHIKAMFTGYEEEVEHVKGM